MKTRKKNKILEEIHYIINNPVLDKDINEYAEDLFPNELIKEVNPLPNQFIYFLNIIENDIVFCSESVTDIIGYKRDKISEEFLLSIVHPEDQDIIFRSIIETYKSGQTGRFGSTHNLLQLNCRLKHKNGSYVQIMFSGEIIVTDKTNKMVYAKCTITDISDLKNNNIISAKVYFNDELILSLSNDIITEGKNKLTKKELKVIDFIIDGFTSKQIAEELEISRHTVDTHRRNILKKLELDSTKALLFYGKIN